MGLIGCGSRPGGLVYPGELRPPTDFAGEFLVHQQLHISREEGEARLQAALQRQGDTLTLIALTPMGTRAFVIQQHGSEVSSTSSLPEELPFPPRFILLDVQRSLLPAIGGGRQLPDGIHREVGNDEVVDERWQGGRLFERRYRRTNRRPRGEIVIRYDGGMAPGEFPQRLTLENGWLGYSLVITTLSVQQLPSSSEPKSGSFHPRGPTF
jgi:hypothetical protein